MRGIHRFRMVCPEEGCPTEITVEVSPPEHGTYELLPEGCPHVEEMGPHSPLWREIERAVEEEARERDERSYGWDRGGEA